MSILHLVVSAIKSVCLSMRFDWIKEHMSMDELKKIGVQLHKERNINDLIRRLDELNTVQNEKQIGNIINKKFEDYSKDLYYVEKAIRNVLRHKKADTQEKILYQTMGESIGVIKFLKELDNNIRNKQIFENKIVQLFESDDVKNIVDKIYIQPDIGLKQLISESHLTDKEIKQYLEILIDDGLVRKFHSEEGENYELTPRMADYYKKYINSQRDIIKKQNTWSKFEVQETSDVLYVSGYCNTYNGFDRIVSREVVAYGNVKRKNKTIGTETRAMVYRALR